MSKSPLILHIIEAAAGGARKGVRYLLQGLTQRGYRVALILSPLRSDPDLAEDLALYEQLGCPVSLLHMTRGPSWSDLRARRTIAAIIAQLQPAIVHTHCAKAGMLGRWAARSLCRTVHTPHSYFFEGLKPRAFRTAGIRLERRLGHATDRLFCISDAERSVALRESLMPEERIDVGHNGLPADFQEALRPRALVRQRLGVTEQQFVIMMNARLEPKKGHRHLLQAVSRLDAGLRDRLRVFCFGRGSLATGLEREVRHLSLGGQVNFPGYRPNVELDLLGMDLGVLPSQYEGLPYQLLESLAAQRPFIASDIPGNKPEFPDNPVRYVPLADTPALADAITELMTSPRYGEVLGRRGGVWVSRHLTLDRQLTALEACYRRLL